MNTKNACMFNNLCGFEGVHTLTLQDHDHMAAYKAKHPSLPDAAYVKAYKAKYTTHVCKEHLPQMGWSLTVWQVQP